MAINIKLHVIGRALARRSRLLASFISLVIIAWFGWIAYTVAIDTILPPEKISAHRLRVNQAQLLQLKTSIANYQNPAAPLPIKTDIIVPASNGSEPKLVN